MTKLYNVHLYREMCLFFPDNKAETPQQAACIAADKPTDDAEHTEDCQGQILSALVDLVGDEQFAHSALVNFEGERLRKAATQLRTALQEAVTEIEYRHADLLSVEERKHPRGSGWARVYDHAKAAIALALDQDSQPMTPATRAHCPGHTLAIAPEASMTLTNQDRVLHCGQAIAAYSDDETYTNFVDFLADAQHWCHANGHSFRHALATARMHFEVEMTDDVLDDPLRRSGFIGLGDT